MSDKEKLNTIVNYLKRSQDGILKSFCELSEEQQTSDYGIDLHAKHNVLGSVLVDVKRIIEMEDNNDI